MTTDSPAGRRGVLAAGLTLALTVVAAYVLVKPGEGIAGPATDTAGKVVTWQNEHGRVLTAAPGVRDKRSLRPIEVAPVAAPAVAALAAAEAPYPDRIQWLYPRASKQVDPTGTAGASIEASGGSNVAMPFLEYYATWSQVSSQVAWFGSAPFAADSITHTDRWHVDFMGTGYDVYGAPPGAAVTTDGSSADVQWTTSVSDNWYSEHAWDFVGFYPENPPQFGQIYRMRHSVTGVFQFGSSFYEVTADARSFT